MPTPDLLAVLSENCPRQQAAKPWDVCGIHCPQLTALR
jgi:hypothetical protein